MVHEASIVGETLQWLHTRLKVLRTTSASKDGLTFGIGHPDPTSRLGLLTELLFWMTRFSLLRRLWTGEARAIIKNARKLVTHGHRRAFRAKIERIIADVNKSIARAEDECEHVLNKSWPEAKLTPKTICRVVGRLKHGTKGLKLRLSEINRLYVTEIGDLVVQGSESDIDRVSTPDTNPDFVDSTASPDVTVLGSSEAGCTQGTPLATASSSRVIRSQAPRVDESFTRHVRLSPLNYSPISRD